MKKYNGNTTKNARIKIDYQKNKPKVSFSYPKKREQKGGSMFHYILFCCFILFFIYAFTLKILLIEQETKYAFCLLQGILYLLILLPMIVYIPFKKYWTNIYPDFMAFKEVKKVAIFKSKDVINIDNKYYCEIPIFNNIVLDYKASKDFSKYIEMFEIREHNFKYMKRKEKVNEWLWYAKFYFKEKPMKGELKVVFK